VTERRLRDWLPAYLCIALLWGCSFLFIKVAVGQLHPLYVSLARVGVGALTLLAVLAVTRQRLPRDPRLWAHLGVVAVLMNTAPFTLFGFGEQRVSSVLAGIWNATTPLFTLLVTLSVFRQERPTRSRMLGLAVGFVGVLVVLGVWRGVGGAGLAGQLMCGGAAVCYGFGLPYTRRFVAGRAESGLSVAAAQLVVATAQLAVLAPLLAGAPAAVTGLRPPVVASVLALGALGTGIAFALNYRVIRVAGTTTSASVTYLMPVVSTAAGAVLLGEPLTWYEPVGALVILAGVAIAQGALGALVRRRGLQPTPAAAEPARY
jgi:drug/metabolite transporter (DMT)-like permease